MSHIEAKMLVGEIAKRHGIRLDGDDPALAIVSLNELVLEKSMQELCDRVRSAIGDFDRGAQKAEARAGVFIAQEVKECARAIRQELQKDISFARLQATETVIELNSAHRQAGLEKWVVVGLISAVILFGCGFWAGTMIH